MKTDRFFSASLTRGSLRFRSLASFCVVFSCFAASLSAVDSRSPYNATADEIAVSYLREHPSLDEPLESFLSTQGIKTGSAADAVKTRVEAVHEILGEGIEVGSNAFISRFRERLLQEPTLAYVRLASVKVIAAAGETITKKTEAREPEESLRTNAYRKFKSYSQTQQIYLVHAFNTPVWPAGEEKVEWRTYTGVTKTGPSPNEKITAATYAPFESFLDRYGESLQKEEKPKPDDENKKPAPSADPAGTTESVVPFNKDASLRDAGISLSQGIGTVISNHRDPTLATLMVRWNMLQRRSTIKWNERVASKAWDNTGRKRITFFGNYGKKLVEDELGPDATPSQVRDLLSSSPLTLTFCGPTLGGAMLGDKVEFGHDTNGNSKKQRPFLVGWSFGFGFFDEAGPAVSFDLGATLSPTTAFSYSRPFVGVSVDGILFTKIFDAIRGAKN